MFLQICTSAYGPCLSDHESASWNSNLEVTWTSNLMSTCILDK
jgi:hypothetical protein